MTTSCGSPYEGPPLNHQSSIKQDGPRSSNCRGFQCLTSRPSPSKGLQHDPQLPDLDTMFQRGSLPCSHPRTKRTDIQQHDDPVDDGLMEHGLHGSQRQGLQIRLWNSTYIHMYICIYTHIDTHIYACVDVYVSTLHTPSIYIHVKLGG